MLYSMWFLQNDTVLSAEVYSSKFLFICYLCLFIPIDWDVIILIHPFHDKMFPLLPLICLCFHFNIGARPMFIVVIMMLLPFGMYLYNIYCNIFVLLQREETVDLRQID
ncbi:hypothetical protein ACH5RR_002768 [Cinchona calisaya]|uniref:Uncharacterized protein n=1 Tax=Cinchona calisaya TaxID=153742 RepID=A0ABD3ASW2_9GENT